MSRHPNRKELTSWLDGDLESLDEHIDNCDRCSARLTKLDSDELGNVAPITPDLRPALLSLLSPPDDLHDRISERIAGRLQDRNDADLFGSMLGIPIEATRIFLEPNPEANLSED